MKTLTLFLGAALILSSCASYYVTSSESIQDSKENGMYYFLPKKTFHVTVTYEKTVVMPSELYRESPEMFKEQVLRLGHTFKGYMKADSSYSISKIDVNKQSIPDSAELYFIHFKGRNNPFYRKNMNFETNQIGLLGKGASEAKSLVPEYVEFAVDLAAQFVGVGKTKVDNKSLEGEINFNNFGWAAPISVVEQIVDRILEIRVERKEILQVNQKKEEFSDVQLEKRLSLLESEEKALLERLAGTKSTQTISKTISVDPKLGDSAIFYFSKKKGLSVNNNGGKKYDFSIQSHVKVDNPYGISSADSSEKSNRGLYYKPISTCTIRLIDSKGNQYFQGIENIPQFVNAVSLPNRAGVFGSDINVSLFTDDGTLNVVDYKSGEISKEQLEGIGTTTGNLFDAKRNAQFKGDLDAIQHLENDIRLKELQQKLDSLNQTR